MLDRIGLQALAIIVWKFKPMALEQIRLAGNTWSLVSC